MNNKGVFGLTAVQTFFAIILGLALLAYVIVVIMGTLNDSTILSGTTQSGSTTNETITPTTAGAALAANTNPNCAATASKVLGYNSTGDMYILNSGNYTVTGCLIANKTSTFSFVYNVTYTFTFDSTAQVNTKNILTNTSTGITGFFSNINPVYAILAILVIILVLIVLVRVVTGNVGYGRVSSSPSL